MTQFGRRLALAALTSIVVVADMRGQTPAGQRPVFRSSADVVDVDVSVQVGGQVVSGLTAADFVVMDNGVKQRVDRVDVAAMPLDVTVVADVAGMTGGAWTTRVSKDTLLRQVDDRVSAMAAILRPGDRIEAIVSDTYVRRASGWKTQEEVAGLARDGGLQFMTTADAEGLSSVYDALVTAMLEPIPLGRRHAVMAWTKSVDSISTTDEARLKTIAYQADAVLHVVLRSSGTNKTPNQSSPSGMSGPGSDDGAPNDGGGGAGLKFGFGNIGEFSHQGYAHTWKPFRRSDPDVLSAAASLTGGTFQPEGVLKDTDVAASFKDIFEAYRRGYVLRYTPTGVKPEGWHDIVVRVPSRSNATIRARHGYGVEANAPAAASRPAEVTNAAATTVPTLQDFVAMFNRRDDTAMQARLRQARDLRGVIRDYRAGDNPWAATPRLEAIFVVELAAAGFLNADVNVRTDARTLLTDYRDLVRAPLWVDLEHPLDAAAFECRWDDVALAALEGTMQSRVVLEIVPDMLTRCASDARLRLARAIAADQSWHGRGERPWPVATPPADGIKDASDVMAFYEAAMAFPATEVEARVRAAWLAYRSNEFDRALDILDKATAGTDDRVVSYFRHLVRAQILRKLTRSDEAIAEYRVAMAAFPGAQAARVGLLTLFIERGDRPSAEALATQVETAPDNTVDPWWVYWEGDYRSFSVDLAALRQLAGAH